MYKNKLKIYFTCFNIFLVNCLLGQNVDSFELIKYRTVQKEIKSQLLNSNQQQILNIQTVVHLIYNQQSQNITDSAMEAIISQVNDIFSGTNRDTSVINPVHRSKITDSKIRLCLTRTDPQGNPTSGVNRRQVATRFNSFELAYQSDQRGGLSPWDTSKYFNIYLVLLDQPNDVNGLIQTYFGFLPRDAFITNRIPVPGFTMDLDYDDPWFRSLFSFEGTFASYAASALGLLDTNGPFNTCDPDDFIEDTPRCKGYNFACASNLVNSCIDTLNDEPDNVSNVMSPFGCLEMFTKGQGEMMYSNLQNGPQGILSGSNCGINSNSLTLNENSSSYYVYPNPTNGTLKIGTDYVSHDIVSFEISNSIGERIKKGSFRASHSHEISLEEKPPGIYFIQFEFGNEIITKRIVLVN